MDDALKTARNGNAQDGFYHDASKPFKSVIEQMPQSMRQNHKEVFLDPVQVMFPKQTLGTTTLTMNATPDKTPAETNNKNTNGMNLLLLPTRETSQDDHAPASLVNKSSNIKKTLSRPAGVQWQGLDPLAWIESLATTTEEKESAANRGRPVAPIRVNNMNLSYKHRFTKDIEKNRQDNYTSPVPWNTKTPSWSTPHEFTCNNSERKRVRVESNESIESIESIDEDDFVAWDLSFLNPTNDCSQRNPLVQRIQALVHQMESLEYGKVKSSYKRVRDHFFFSYEQIMEQKSSLAHPGEHGHLLDALYKGTIQKLESVVSMAQFALVAKSEDENTEQVVTGAFPSTPVEPVLAASNPSSSLSSVQKKEVANYLTAWLRANWINPYPDDSGLDEMAEACGTTSTVVSNWLINARTRKWRPAIVKAFQMNRPSDMLLEDSLNIFDGKPIRELSGTIPSSSGDEPTHQSATDIDIDIHRSTKRAKRNF